MIIEATEITYSFGSKLGVYSHNETISKFESKLRGGFEIKFDSTEF